MVVHHSILLGDPHTMKKLMTIMLGLSFLSGVIVLADDPKPTDKKTDKKKTGKGKKDTKKADDKKS
jgi:hypothetical protein